MAENFANSAVELSLTAQAIVCPISKYSNKSNTIDFGRSYVT